MNEQKLTKHKTVTGCSHCHDLPALNSQAPKKITKHQIGALYCVRPPMG